MSAELSLFDDSADAKDFASLRLIPAFKSICLAAAKIFGVGCPRTLSNVPSRASLQSADLTLLASFCNNSLANSMAFGDTLSSEEAISFFSSCSSCSSFCCVACSSSSFAASLSASAANLASSSLFKKFCATSSKD